MKESELEQQVAAAAHDLLECAATGDGRLAMRTFVGCVVLAGHLLNFGSRTRSHNDAALALFGRMLKALTVAREVAVPRPRGDSIN